MREFERVLLSIYTTRCHGGDGTGLEAILPPARTRFYAYGRQALADALRCAGIGAGDTVLMPGLIGRGVLASVKALGASPLFYRVNEMMEVDDKSLSEVPETGIKAAVAVNYFGFPQALERLLDWCWTHDAVLIEDNAHGFLSADGPSMLGRRGHLGVFSLFKTLSLPNGAAFVDNRSGHMTREAGNYSNAPSSSVRRHRAKTLVKGLIELASLASPGVALKAVSALRRVTEARALAAEATASDDSLPQEAFAPRSARLLRRVDLAGEVERRRWLFGWCQKLLGAEPGVHPIHGRVPDGVAPQGFPFFYTGDIGSFIRHWGVRGVPVVQWPARLALDADSAPRYYLRILIVPFLW